MHLLGKILFILTILSVSHFSQAQIPRSACLGLFELKINPEQFKALREQGLQMTTAVAHDRGPIFIGTKTYYPQALLGKSRSVVWLTENELGLRIVVKETQDRKAKHFMPYEFYVARYYAEIGLPVAKFYSYGVNQKGANMTLEYIEGLRHSEIRDVYPEIQIELRQSLYLTVNRFRRARWGFIPWLIKKGLWSSLIVGFNDLDTLTGDLYDQNFVFSPTRNEWVLIDP